MPFRIKPAPREGDTENPFHRVRQPGGGPVLEKTGIVITQLGPYWTRRQADEEIVVEEVTDEQLAQEEEARAAAHARELKKKAEQDAADTDEPKE